ncbi:5-(carboxyamino)imidazole ribonucleotide synthase [Alkaliphilus crotonatoxidans]
MNCNDQPKTIGIIGGGQLGKMLILEGKKMGITFVVLDPDGDCPGASLADQFIQADYYDAEGLKRLAENSDIITYEFEHIDGEMLEKLAEEGHIILPKPGTLILIQDKLKQKNFLKGHGIPVGAFQEINAVEDLKEIVGKWGLPLLLKKRRGGYDGRGNLLLHREISIETAYQLMGAGRDSLMAEKYVPFVKEISAIAARGWDGEIKVFPLAENIHKDNILHETLVPAEISPCTQEQAQKIAREVMKHFDGAGLFCIEMFVLADGKILVNEIAPRTHNSGHFTIEACRTSQFQQQLRALLALPLGDTKLISPCVMLNLLGAQKYHGQGSIIGLKEALRLPGVYLHYYGKKETRPQRKMGHINILADTLEEARSLAEGLKSTVKITGAIKEE